MINNSTKLSGMQTLQTSEYSVINFGQCVGSFCLQKNMALLGKKSLQTSEYSVTNFEKFVESLCPHITNLFDLLNNTRFLKVMVTIHGRKNWL